MEIFETSSKVSDFPNISSATSDIPQCDGLNISITSSSNSETKIPTIVGFRPKPVAQPARVPVRKTIRRSNKMIQALSLPTVTLYNMRSIWSKLENLIDDIEERKVDICLLTEVWQVLENKEHQKKLEEIFQMRNIQYISTPRPGGRRGGGTAIAVKTSNKYFHMTKLNIANPDTHEVVWALLRPHMMIAADTNDLNPYYIS